MRDRATVCHPKDERKTCTLGLRQQPPKETARGRRPASRSCRIAKVCLGVTSDVERRSRWCGEAASAGEAGA